MASSSGDARRTGSTVEPGTAINTVARSCDRGVYLHEALASDHSESSTAPGCMVPDYIVAESSTSRHLQGFSELCGIITKLVEERTSSELPCTGPGGASPVFLTEEEINIGDVATLARPVGEAALPLSICNPGSIGHPELCSRKCLYYASGSCSNGDACNFCHMPHDKRPARLDRMNRDLLRNMSFVERAAIIVPLIAEKVQVLNLSLTGVLALEECVISENPSFPELVQAHAWQKPSPKLKLLRNALKRHSVRLLILLLRDVDMSPRLKAALDPLAEQMRQY